MLESWPRVVTLRSLCIRVVHRHQVPTAAVPPLLLVYPDEIREASPMRPQPSQSK